MKIFNAAYMKIIMLFIFLCFIGLTPPPPMPKDRGIYSNLKPGTSGIGGPNYYGMELFVCLGGHLFMQYADGKLHVPIVTTYFMHSDKHNFHFIVPKEMGSFGEFKGIIDEKHIEGRFEGNGMEIYLPKKLSIWQE